jgi:hypothetical protein
MVYSPQGVVAAPGRQRNYLLLIRALQGRKWALRRQVQVLLLLLRLIRAQQLVLLVLHRGCSCKRSAGCKKVNVLLHCYVAAAHTGGA